MGRRLATAVLVAGLVFASQQGRADEQTLDDMTAALEAAKQCPALGVNTDVVQAATQQLVAEKAEQAPIVNSQGDFSTALAGSPLPGGALNAPAPPPEEAAPPVPPPAPEGLSGDCLQLFVDFGPDGQKYPGLFYLVDYETQPQVAPDSQSGAQDDSQSRGDVGSSSDGSARGASGQ